MADFDVAHGWNTDRLELEPLAEAHAAELAAPFDDPALHEFIGGSPVPEAALAARYAKLQERRSPDGEQVWGNWVLRVRDSGVAIGYVQATLPTGGPYAGPAEVAWVVARTGQGHGYAREAAASLIDRLHAAGWTVIAHVHPGHLASQRVAAAAGLRPTDQIIDGEVRWISEPAPRRQALKEA